MSMTVQRRFFQLDNQWCIIHLPERPNGFALLIIGDTNHFVNDRTSFWIDHKGRSQLLCELLEYGYTIFYSHLYGRHWGSPKAVRLAKQLIYYVLKSEILNNRIYILAEGMGALVALQLLETMPKQIRAIVMLSPCLDLRAQLEYEKENEFFYKRMKREIALAYGIDEANIEKAVPSLFIVPHQVPIKIWQLSGITRYSSSLHCRKYEQWMGAANNNVHVTYYLPEKRYQFGKAIHQFYQRYNELP
jgi:pimeloyl-ACP methyl ester carboxylesterase